MSGKKANKSGIECRLIAKRELVYSKLRRFCKKYGSFRVATLDTSGGPGCDKLVLFTPVIMLEDEIPLAAVTVLDPVLYKEMVEGFGSVKVAIAYFRMEMASLHFTESEQEG